jgi:hypothetical protein
VIGAVKCNFNQLRIPFWERSSAYSSKRKDQPTGALSGQIKEKRHLMLGATYTVTRSLPSSALFPAFNLVHRTPVTWVTANASSPSWFSFVKSKVERSHGKRACFFCLVRLNPCDDRSRNPNLWACEGPSVGFGRSRGEHFLALGHISTGDRRLGVLPVARAATDAGREGGDELDPIYAQSRRPLDR